VNSLKIVEKKILELNLKGKGGREQELISCFENNLERKNAVIYDVLDKDTGEKYEFKKQVNTQWFDPRKFYGLKEDERNVTIIFVLIDHDGNCDSISLVNLGKFIERNYSQEQLKDAFHYGKKYPKDQIKSGIRIRDFVQNNSDIVQMIWTAEICFI